MTAWIFIQAQLVYGRKKIKEVKSGLANTSLKLATRLKCPNESLLYLCKKHLLCI